MTQKMEGKQLRRLSPSEEWGCGGGGREGGMGDGVKGGREGSVVVVGVGGVWAASGSLLTGPNISANKPN